MQVDAELSTLVRRSFALTAPAAFHTPDDSPILNGGSVDPTARIQDDASSSSGAEIPEESKTVLQTVYAATTNRMLRVAVNGFMESLGVVLAVMEELDVDVLAESAQSDNR